MIKMLMMFILLFFLFTFMNFSYSMLIYLFLMMFFLFYMGNFFNNFEILGNFILIDSTSFSLILLSFFITFLMILSSSSIDFKDCNFYLFSILIFIMFFSLYLSFTSLNLLMFYFFFEMSLIPILLIIMGWGYQPERLQAGVYMLFYTLFGSLPLLMVLLYFYNKNFSSDLFYTKILFFLNMNFYVVLMFYSLIFAFLVKMPMFLFHLWLPKAHVEAPVAGSMILAGVLLKLGGYGLFRVLKFIPYFLYFSSSLVVGLSLSGMFFVGLICCRLNDLKVLIAYSSVAHMGLVICGLFSMSVLGMNGVLAMMLSHGLSSSGLFCIANMYYERSSSRSFFMNKGLLTFLPLMSIFMFLLCACNISAPPSMNLISEVLLMMSVLNFDVLMMLMFFIGSFLGAVFTIYMFSFTQHGKFMILSNGFMFVSHREYLNLMSHLIPLFFIFLKSEFFMFI
uniref:NADH-ubiquinone oxidoreductase chain 4 n=1 Tax=Oncopodura yosiiana TaxID=2581075 RepID=A0A6H0EXC6_9HEXA|nr:NADH dehydrogenase subunit 4 [Oncopodura yosiiana]QIT06427.1 NADH dehydrogenase subunit 4 [Oncopodura yosiiana]